jgi:uncharacterized protein (TIGR03545 family)
MSRKRFKLFRWRAVGPLLLFLVLLVVLWILFADRIVRRETEANLSAILGTQVDIGSLRIREADAAVDMGGLAIAHPGDPNRNLLEAGSITLDLDPLPLAEKKIIVEEVKLSGLRFFTSRATPARPADPNSPAGKLLQETGRWATDKFQLPKLVLARVDTLKDLVLNPGQLGTVQAAAGLAGKADSTRDHLERTLARLEIGPMVDSSAALADRLAKADPKKLGLAGARDAVASAQRAIDGLKQARSRLQELETTTKASMASLARGLSDVDAARQRDYAFARGLLALPSLDAPNIGAALFGTQSLDYFQRALFYARVAEKYVPPGLQPWNRPGPKRTRMDGTTVEFPKEREYPRFLVKKGDIDLAVGEGARHEFAASFAGITSQPALYGRPATLDASGRLGGDRPVSVSISALSRHFGASPKDSLAARVSGVHLPAISVPELPFVVNPGRSTVGLAFSLAGDRLRGTWEVASDEAAWTTDTTRAGQASLVETTVWEVVRGLSQLRIRADLGGTLESPTLKVGSNLDDAIAARLRGLAGEALAKGEAKAREAVDRLVAPQVTALQGKMNTLQEQVVDRLPVERGRLDDIQKKLEREVKRLAGSAAGGLRLPKL